MKMAYAPSSVSCMIQRLKDDFSYGSYTRLSSLSSQDTLKESHELKYSSFYINIRVQIQPSFIFLYVRQRGLVKEVLFDAAVNNRGLCSRKNETIPVDFCETCMEF